MPSLLALWRNAAMEDVDIEDVAANLRALLAPNSSLRPAIAESFHTILGDLYASQHQQSDVYEAVIDLKRLF